VTRTESQRARRRRTTIHTAPQQLAHSLTDAARSLNIGTTKLGELVASGEIPSFKIGRRRLVTPDALAEYVRKVSASQARRV